MINKNFAKIAVPTKLNVNTTNSEAISFVYTATETKQVRGKGRFGKQDILRKNKKTIDIRELDQKLDSADYKV